MGQFTADMGLTVLVTTDDLLQKYDRALDRVLKTYKVRKVERMVNLNTLKSTLGPARER